MYDWFSFKDSLEKFTPDDIDATKNAKRYYHSCLDESNIKFTEYY